MKPEPGRRCLPQMETLPTGLGVLKSGSCLGSEWKPSYPATREAKSALPAPQNKVTPEPGDT